MEKFDSLILKWIWFELCKFNFFSKPEFSLEEEIKRVKAVNWYDKWLKETIRLFVENGFLEYISNGRYRVLYEGIVEEELNHEIEAAENSCIDNKSNSLTFKFAKIMLSKLSDVIIGKESAVTLMFSSGFDLVGNIYKNNKHSDYYNEVLAEVADIYIEEKLSSDPSYKFRILEIGAGTGATSAIMFKHLEKFRNSIAEYYFTDISHSFLKNAKNEYLKKYDYLRFKLYNVEKDMNEQEMKPDYFDIILSANCIHATSSIKRSLAHMNQLLKKGGLLVLNEMSKNSILSHITFGMLEGWWLYEDTECRLVGSPVVESKTWELLMKNVGFTNIMFPVEHSHKYGQQIVVGFANNENSGYYTDEKIISEPEIRKSEVKADNPTVISSDDNVRNIIIDALVEILEVDKEMIDDDASFVDFGIDSINGMNLVQLLNEKFNVEIDVTSIFDYNNIRKLKEYIDGILGDENVLLNEVEKENEEKLPVVEDTFEISSNAPINIVSESDKTGYVIKVIKQVICGVLEIEEDIISDDEAFAEIGVDSITGIRLVDAINERLEIDIDVTKIFDYSNIKSLAGFICSQIGDIRMVSDEALSIDAIEEAEIADMGLCQDEIAPVSMEEEKNKSDSNEEEKKAFLASDFAIIGISCRFGSAETKETLWDVLVNGESTISRHGEFYISKLADREMFDNEFFSISKTEADYMDPQQRIFLEETWSALEDAGYANEKSNEKKCGVYVGCNAGDYTNHFDESAPAQAFWGNSASIIPSRISYFLNLKGPAVSLETACSSSLVAIDLACKALQDGEVDMAVCGGVFVQTTDNFLKAAKRAEMLSPDGKCYTFDNNANGFVTGEGAGVIIIKRLDDAVRDNDNIYAVVKGISSNHDGETNGITAPSSLSQTELECYVYDRYNIDPSTISYIEAHGTGTRLGDPIEIKALTNAFRRYTDKKQFCHIGSIKTNIGHTITAAGIASVIKVILAMKNQIIPAHLNYSQTNSFIDMKNSPFKVNTSSIKWDTENDMVRRAGISSFGFSGTNVHMILEEYRNEQRKSKEIRPVLFLFSAKNIRSLRKQLSSFVNDKSILSYNISDISYTLLCRRKHFNERVAFIASDINELISYIREYLLNDITDNLNNYRESKLYGYADSYLNGEKVDFELLFNNVECKCVPLPLYAFDRKKCWVGCEESSISSGSSKEVKDLINSSISKVLKMPKDILTPEMKLKEIGMDSIFMLEIMNTLKKDGVEIDYSNIRSCEKISDIYDFLSVEYESEKVRCDEMVKINKSKNGTPVFWFHPAMGGVDIYNELAVEIDRPFYGFIARGWLTRKKPIHGVENMAKYYISQIKQVQKGGPYEVGGYSLGGIIAYEAARQLQENGDEVKSLMMVDSMFNKSLNNNEQTENGLIFSAANSLVMSSGPLSSIHSRLILNDEVNFDLESNIFMEKVIKLLKEKNPDFSLSTIKTFIKSSVKIRRDFAVSEFNIMPLKEPDKIRCVYFHNESEKMLGQYASFLGSNNESSDINITSSNYSEWLKVMPNLEIVKTNASNHLEIFMDNNSKKIIFDKCAEVYDI